MPDGFFVEGFLVLLSALLPAVPAIALHLHDPRAIGVLVPCAGTLELLLEVLRRIWAWHPMPEAHEGDVAVLCQPLHTTL